MGVPGLSCASDARVERRAGSRGRHFDGVAFFHRATAALRAFSLRSSGVRFFAPAAPPLRPIAAMYFRTSAGILFAMKSSVAAEHQPAQDFVDMLTR